MAGAMAEKGLSAEKIAALTQQANDCTGIFLVLFGLLLFFVYFAFLLCRSVIYCF